MRRAKAIAFAASAFALTFSTLAGAYAADPAPSPSPSSSPTATSAAPSTPTLAPNYRDPEIPQIQSLTTSAQKVHDQFILTAELFVKIHSNALNYIEINLQPKTTGTPQNPKLVPPCVKLGSIKSPVMKAGDDIPTLQSRTASNGWYLERHVVTLAMKLPPVQYPTSTPAYQDVCDGQYVISTIVLKDLASHTLTLTANASSTAPISTTATGTASNKSKYTDASTMQADFWTDGFSMPCGPNTNLAPVVTSSIVNGRTVTSTAVPATSSTIRSTCNQSLDFGKIYLTVDGAGSGTTVSQGTTSLPIVDFASQTQTALSENNRMKNQIDILTKQVDALQKSVNIFRSGGKAGSDSTSTTSSVPNSNLPIVDYQARAIALQAQVAALTKQLVAAGVKPATGVTLPTPKSSSLPKPTVQSKPTSTAVSGFGGGSGSGGGSRHYFTNPPVPARSKSPTPSPTKASQPQWSKGTSTSPTPKATTKR